MSNPKICPVLLMSNPVHMAKCRGDGCAWWDWQGGVCCMASGADCIRDVADALSIMILAVQEHEKTAPSAANTESGEGKKQTLSGPVFTSNDTKETEDLQA